MAFVWLLTAVTWAAHLGLAFVPGSLPALLLARHVPPWIQAALCAALLPQLILVPWAWRDAGTRSLPPRARLVWRAFFFLTGFVAVTAYAFRYRLTCSRRTA